MHVYNFEDQYLACYKQRKWLVASLVNLISRLQSFWWIRCALGQNRSEQSNLPKLLFFLFSWYILFCVSAPDLMPSSSRWLKSARSGRWMKSASFSLINFCPSVSSADHQIGSISTIISRIWQESAWRMLGRYIDYVFKFTDHRELQ